MFVADPLPTPAPIVVRANLKDIWCQIVTLNDDIFNDLVKT